MALKYAMQYIPRLPIALVMAGLFTPALSGCNGIPVTLPLAQGIELPAATAATGRADIVLGVFCDLFNEEELDARVRAAAGDLIADLVRITRIELEATEITASDGDFGPFTDASLRITLLDLDAEPLLLGEAGADNGLGSVFALTRDPPLDLLSALGNGECGVPTLHLEGASILEPSDVVFDVSVHLVVYTEFTF